MFRVARGARAASRKEEEQGGRAYNNEVAGNNGVVRARAKGLICQQLAHDRIPPFQQTSGLRKEGRKNSQGRKT